MESNLLRLVGKKIREIRRSQEISQEKLAEMCGLHINYIGGLERGERNVTLLSLEKVSAELGVSISELFSYVQELDQVDENNKPMQELVKLLLNRSEKDIRFVTRLLKDLYQTYD